MIEGLGSPARGLGSTTAARWRFRVAPTRRDFEGPSLHCQANLSGNKRIKM